ncbi:MAG TPA: hypothetical protein VGG33_02225 [Polyangia bacterium]
MRKTTLVLALLAAACGGDKKELGAGIPIGNGDAAASFDAAFDSPAPATFGSVSIEILAPANDAILSVATGPEVRARIRSTNSAGASSADPILPESVRFFVGTPDPKAPSVTGTLTGPSLTAEYFGRMDLTTLPTGFYVLAVTASTRAGAQGLARIAVVVDAGPKVTILSPRHQGSYKGSTTVEVAVEAAPFELAEMPQAFVGSVGIPLEPGDGPGRFRGTIEFAKFTPPLIDEQLFRVVARNRQGTAAEGRAVFFVDEDGPLIADTSPDDGDVIGGVVRIAARVTDRAGVLGPSVVAFIGNRGGEGFELELLPEGGGTGVFSALFDTRKLSSCKLPRGNGLCVLWPSVSYRASDLLGNETVLAYDVGIDNQPPLIDLDPPSMRVTKFDNGWRCSWAFDPLGWNHRLGDMPDDGCVVGQVFDLRARIEDQGNWATGSKLPPVATVDPPTVTAYVMDDTTQPLSVDTDADGICDAVNPTLIPTTMPPKSSKEILAVRLVPLAPGGSADFTSDPSLLGSGCALGRDIEAPAPLCIAQELTLTLGYHAARGPEPAIWAIEPIDQPFCVGGQFDSHANLLYNEGWMCLAVVATDRVGNKSVSHPLRVYVHHKAADLPVTETCPAPPPNAGPPPDCTGAFDRKTNALITGTCKGERFAPGEVRAR